MSHAISTTAPTLPLVRRPAFVAAGAGLAAAWNAYGVVKLLETVTAGPETFQAMGMTAEQAAIYGNQPLWMTAAFAVGVLGGLTGSVLVGLRRRFAVPVLAASLVGYLVLFVGDVTEGVFAALGAPQVAVLSFVVAVAAAMFAWASDLRRHGALR